MTVSPSAEDGSVSFSLRELERLERERLALVREEARAREEEQRKRAEEEAFRAWEAEQERAHREEERRREEELRAREENARIEGMQRAIVERERIRVEQAARAEEADRIRRHEIELQCLRGAAGTHALGAKTAWSAAALLGMALGACLVVYSAVIKPQADRRIAQVEATSAERSLAIDEAQKRLGELGGRVQGLQQSLHETNAHAKDVERRLEDAHRALATCSSGGRKPVVLKGHPVESDAPKGLLGGNCNPDDPLCSRARSSSP